MIPVRMKEYFDQILVEFFAETSFCDANISEANGIQPPPTNGVLASIGFSSAEIKGTLHMVTTSETLKACHPMVALGADVSENSINDWAGEMLNQLGGRFKKHLVPLKIVLQISLPTVVKGTKMTVSNQQWDGHILRRLSTNTDHSIGFGINFAFDKNFDVQSFDSIELVMELTKQEGETFVF